MDTAQSNKCPLGQSCKSSLLTILLINAVVCTRAPLQPDAVPLCAANMKGCHALSILVHLIGG